MPFPFLIFGLSAAASAVVSAVGAVFGLGGGAGYLSYRGTSTAKDRRAARRGRRSLRKEAVRQQGLLGRLRGRIRGALERTQAQETEGRIQRAPVEVLKPRVAGRIRWNSLADAGIQTIADIRAKTRAELTALDGIGEKSADELITAAAEWRQELTSGPPRAPDAELHSRRSVEVARRAVAYQDARAALGPVAAELTTTIDRLNRQAAEAKRAGGFWTWLFRRRGPKWEEAQRLSRELREETERALPLIERAAAARKEAKRAAKAKHTADAVRQRYRDEFASLASDIEASTRDEKGLASRPANELDDSTLATIERTKLAGEGISVGLRRYQQFGAKFLLAQQRTILGDEMGLGKTIQTLAAMAQIWNERSRAHFVVVAPASIVINWEREFKDKSYLPAIVAHGRDKQSSVETWLHNAGALVISYATLRAYPLHEELDTAGRQIDMLVADEAHYVKNPDAARSQAVGQLVERSDRVVFLTGTPMENHPREFAELLQRLQPRVRIPVSPDDFDTAHAHSTAKRFREAIAPVYLRRNQVDVLLELPDRIELEEWVQLTREQSEAYRDAVDSSSFMKMRQVVTLPPEGDGESSRAALSSKFRRLDELLHDHAEEGRKVLVFSYFLAVLAEVERRYDTVGCISGGVSGEDRFAMIDDFSKREGHAILSAQITAAGQGLNLQAASVVILLEPQYTPTIEAQAIARAHRMGQTQRVIVHRLLAADTVDQRLVEILSEKESLFDAYARESVAKDENPEAIEAHLVKKILEIERDRLASGAA